MSVTGDSGLDHVAVIRGNESHSEAKAIALKIGYRAIDAYYIATAKHRSLPPS